MRAYSWIAFGMVARACGGGAFNSAGSEPDGEGGDDGGGTLNKAGRGTGGSLLGSGGKLGNGGTLGKAGGIGIAGDLIIAGNLGVAGDLVTAGSMSMGGEPGVAGSGVGPDPIDEVCPKTLPEVGAGCADGLSCSYGTDIRAACRMRAKCVDGQWSLYEADANACPDIHACATDIVVGSHCDVDSADCLKDGPKYCACVFCLNGACSTESTWQCGGPPPQGCPSLIPNEGQPCQSQLACTYGTCGINDVTQAKCNGATWGWEGLGCVD